MNNILSTIFVILLSTSKYAMGAGVALVGDLGLLMSYLTNIGGGLIGIIAFIYFGGLIKKTIQRFVPMKTKKKFSWSNRFLVKFKTNFGLAGIAFLTPVLLTIPIGIFISLSLTSDKKRIFIAMLVSCIFWSTVFFVPYYWLGLDVIESLKNIF